MHEWAKDALDGVPGDHYVSAAMCVQHEDSDSEEPQLYLSDGG